MLGQKSTRGRIKKEDAVEIRKSLLHSIAGKKTPEKVNLEKKVGKLREEFSVRWN